MLSKKKLSVDFNNIGKMTQVKNINWRARLGRYFLSLLMVAGVFSLAFGQDEAAAVNGKKLYEENCATCHKIVGEMTGPQLYEAESRVPGGREKIYEWVKKPGALVKTDDYFKALYEKYNKTAMTAYPNFSNADIDGILDYVAEAGASAGTAKAGPQPPSLTEDEELTGLWNWVRLLIFLVVLLLGNIALQVARLRGVEILKGVDLDKLNSRLWLGFLVFGMAGAFWSIYVYKDTFIMSNSASEHGESIDFMFWITMAVAMIVFVGTNALLMWFAYKYPHGEGRKAKFYPENHKLELIWTVVPAIVLTILVVFGIRTWTNVMVADPPKDAFQVELNAQQFAWNLRYPGPDGKFGTINLHLIDEANNLLGVNFAEPVSHDDFMSNELYLPKGVPVILRIRSRDVLHSVHMPHFRVKMDAVPGMPTRFTLTPKYTTEEYREIMNDPEFEYELACAEVCGRSHYSMKRIIKVVEKDEYVKWLAEQSKSVPLYDPSVAYKGIDMEKVSQTADASLVQ